MSSPLHSSDSEVYKLYRAQGESEFPDKWGLIAGKRINIILCDLTDYS